MTRLSIPIGKLSQFVRGQRSLATPSSKRSRSQRQKPRGYKSQKIPVTPVGGCKLRKRSSTPSSCRCRSKPLSAVVFEDEDMHNRWEKATKGRPPLELSVEDLSQLVYSGMPMKYRHGLWTQLTSKGASALGDVGKLQTQASEDAIMRVEHDVPRTQPAWLDDGQLARLRRVLLAYAAWNPTVGYCQGMNFIAAVFICLGFNEADTFAGLRYLVEEVCVGYHSCDLGGFHRDAEVLGELVRRFLPSAHSELVNAGVPVNLLAVDHFMSLTARAWPLGPTVRLWDVLFLEGPRALFALFLVLLEMYLPVPSDDCSMTAFEMMDTFKRDSLRGVTDDTDAVFIRLRKYVQMIPDSMIQDLRAEASGGKRPLEQSSPSAQGRKAQRKEDALTASRKNDPDALMSQVLDWLPDSSQYKM